MHIVSGASFYLTNALSFLITINALMLVVGIKERQNNCFGSLVKFPWSTLVAYRLTQVNGRNGS